MASGGIVVTAVSLLPATLVVLLQVALPVEVAECREPDLTALVRGDDLMARGDVAAARQALGAAPQESTACGLITVARLALDGWIGARAAAPAGGAPEVLAPVRKTLDLIRLQAPDSRDQAPGLRAPAPGSSGQAPGLQEVLGLQIEYAETTIRAAMAAAQDERPEMELLLTHARDLVQRLEERKTRARWPRPFNLVAGELWFEVDRYEEARLAYERAVVAEPSASALIGLARAEARLGRLIQACATYKRVRDAAPSLRQAAASDLAKCR